MVIKFLTERAVNKTDRNPCDLYFTNTSAKLLKPQGCSVWSFQHSTETLSLQRGNILVCTDGIRQVSGRSGASWHLLHFREATIPEEYAGYKLTERFAKWLAENENWKPPVPIRIDDGTWLADKFGMDRVTIYRSSATNAQLKHENIHFIENNSPREPPAEGTHILTRRGSLWRMVKGKPLLKELNFLVFPEATKTPRT